MVTHDDVCDSCDAVGRTCRMRWPDGETREMCGPCERRWMYIWRHFCELQPRQANRVRAQANRRSRTRPDGGEPMTDGGRRGTFNCDDCGGISREHLLGATIWANGSGEASVKPWTSPDHFSRFWRVDA